MCNNAGCNNSQNIVQPIAKPANQSLWRDPSQVLESDNGKLVVVRLPNKLGVEVCKIDIKFDEDELLVYFDFQNPNEGFYVADKVHSWMYYKDFEEILNNA